MCLAPWNASQVPEHKKQFAATPAHCSLFEHYFLPRKWATQFTYSSISARSHRIQAVAARQGHSSAVGLDNEGVQGLAQGVHDESNLPQLFVIQCVPPASQAQVSGSWSAAAKSADPEMQICLKGYHGDSL